MSGITVTGRVLKVEHKAGTFVNDAGESIKYDFHQARILCGDEVVEVKFKSDRPDCRPPAKGADICVEVELPGRIKATATAYVDRPAVKAV